MNSITSESVSYTHLDVYKRQGLVDAQLRVDGISIGGITKDIGLTFWGKNLTSKKYVSRAVDFGQLGFAGTIYGDPRTYGVTLDMEF